MNHAGRPWYCRLRWLLLLAVGTHLACVVLLPRVVMGAAMSRLAAVSGGVNGARLAPPTEAASRRIVMPSPDMRYAICVYDLADGPVEVVADPRWPAYWSLALYDARTDNYRSWNDRQLRGRGLHLRLVREADARAPSSPTQVVSPTRRGLVVLRLLVTGQPQRGLKVSPQVLRCGPHSGARG